MGKISRKLKRRLAKGQTYYAYRKTGYGPKIASAMARKIFK